MKKISRAFKTPFFKTQMSENLILSYFAKNIESHESTIAELEPNLKNLDEDSLIRLIKAMEAVGRVEDAIKSLKKKKKTKKDPDLLETLGDLYRNKYLKSNSKKDGKKALKCHKAAFKLAVATEDEEQIFTNAVKMAFMYVKLDMNKRKMREHATKALEGAQAYFYPSNSKLVTLAEANIYLGNLEASKKYYKEVAEKAGVRYRMKCYEQAALVYNSLFDPQNQKDPFLVFLEDTLLT